MEIKSSVYPNEIGSFNVITDLFVAQMATNQRNICRFGMFRAGTGVRERFAGFIPHSDKIASQPNPSPDGG